MAPRELTAAERDAQSSSPSRGTAGAPVRQLELALAREPVLATPLLLGPAGVLADAAELAQPLALAESLARARLRALAAPREN